MMNETAELWEFLRKNNPDEDRPKLSKDFVYALRTAVEVGMTSEQITSIVMVAARVYEMMDLIDGRELVGRTYEMTEVMRGDVELIRKREGMG